MPSPFLLRWMSAHFGSRSGLQHPSVTLSRPPAAAAAALQAQHPDRPAPPVTALARISTNVQVRCAALRCAVL